MDKTGNIMAKKGACDMHLDQLKERQRMTWETGDYSQIGTTLQIVSEVLCEQADLRAGSSVLDVCTGSGNTAIAAARRWCRVTGVDFSPQLRRSACSSIEWLSSSSSPLSPRRVSRSAVTTSNGVSIEPAGSGPGGLGSAAAG
jgi:tRNA/tmRNA/rRNA uracil-C5-methylase (TrmA/RlmC/RlmD family)